MSRERYLDDEGLEDDEEESVFDEDELDEGDPLYGPDDRDADLLDGTWERRYYSGQARSFNWEAVYIALTILALVGLVVPLILIAR